MEDVSAMFHSQQFALAVLMAEGRGQVDGQCESDGDESHSVRFPLSFSLSLTGRRLMTSRIIF